MFSLLMLFAMQEAPAQDGPFHHGVWTGQCWLTGMKTGPLCRATGGKPGKLWIMIERSPAKMDVYASGACSDELPPVTLTQAQLAGADRVKAVSAAIGEAAAKANAACKTNEAFAGTDEDLAGLLGDTDLIAGGTSASSQPVTAVTKADMPDLRARFPSVNKDGRHFLYIGLDGSGEATALDAARSKLAAQGWDVSFRTGEDGARVLDVSGEHRSVIEIDAMLKRIQSGEFGPIAASPSLMPIMDAQ